MIKSEILAFYSSCQTFPWHQPGLNFTTKGFISDFFSQQLFGILRKLPWQSGQWTFTQLQRLTDLMPQIVTRWVTSEGGLWLSIAVAYSTGFKGLNPTFPKINKFFFWWYNSIMGISTLNTLWIWKGGNLRCSFKCSCTWVLKLFPHYKWMVWVLSWLSSWIKPEQKWSIKLIILEENIIP